MKTDNVEDCGKYLGKEEECRHTIAWAEIGGGSSFYRKKLWPQTQQQRGLQIAIELVKERFLEKAEPVEPEVSPKRFKKIGMETTENVGSCGRYLWYEDECSGMAGAIEAGLCELCSFYQKVRSTESIKLRISAAAVGLERVIESVKRSLPKHLLGDELNHTMEPTHTAGQKKREP